MYKKCMKYCYQSELPNDIDEAFYRLEHIEEFLSKENNSKITNIIKNKDELREYIK